MKKLNILAALSFVLMILVSCSEEITREPSPEFNPSSNKVYFPKQESKVIVAIDAETIDVQIARKVVKDALTLDLKYSNTYADFFKGPETVTFAAGDSIETIQITLGEIELMKEYLFSISISDVNQTDPYAVSDVYPVIALNVMKEDFMPFAKGIYTDLFWNTVSAQEKVLEYSSSLEVYRMKGLFDGTGDDFLFEWDGAQTIVLKDGSGPKLAKYLAKGYNTGYYMADNSSYVYAFFVSDQTVTKGGGKLSYDSTTKTFTFPIFWGLASGSGWGWKLSTYQITELQ